MDKIDLKGVTLEQLQEFVESYGEPRFRAAQILDWLYKNRVDSLSEMANLSKACIEKLKDKTCAASLALQETDDNRYVFGAKDNNQLHSMLKNGRLYLATQIGCSCKCKFCPYSKIGLIRNLTTGEIVDQVLKIQDNQWGKPTVSPALRCAVSPFLRGNQHRLKGKSSFPLKNSLLSCDIVPISQDVKEIALGGMGEPLANYDNVLNAIKIINGQWGLGITLKHIFLYTCGIASKIKELADTKLPIRLIVGLHSVDDETRTSLMSVNSEYPVDTLLNAVKYYGHKTGITVELEYMLFDGINDSYGDAKLLVKKLLGLPVRLALVTYEPVSRVRLKPVNEGRQDEFLNTLLSNNIKAEIR